MSLNKSEVQRTAAELQNNFDLSGLTELQVADDLGFTTERVRATVQLAGGQAPADVWLLRDYLEQAVLDAGLSPAPFSVLTERSRAMAEKWFRLRQAPRHAFSS